MKSLNISPLIKAGFTTVSIIALWLGINEYSEVKTLTHDSTLAIMRMFFMVVLVYGVSYISFLGGSYLIPKITIKLSSQPKAGVKIGSSRETYDEMCTLETKRNEEAHDWLMKSLSDYTTFTFSKKLPAEQIDIIVENIQLLSQGKDAACSITHKMAGVTSNDLYHFGWNVGKRLKRTNIQIAWFLKDTFKTMLDDVSVDTVQTKLANKEGNFTLKLIPLDQELIPHVFPAVV